MKAITLWQPWATLVAIGAKKIETRSWSTSYHGPLAIHAAIRIPGSAVKLLDPGLNNYAYEKNNIVEFPFLEALRNGGYSHPSWLEGNRIYINLPLGCIVAICDLTGCFEIYSSYEVFCLPEGEKAFGDYTPGRFMWALANVRRIEEPIPVKGRQGLWEWTEAQA